MVDKIKPPKRLNRVVGLSEAIGGALGTILKKRGFASRDIITNWVSMAPRPYGDVAMPDKLVWPRGNSGAEGATLYLRCAPGHAMAIAHEGATIAAAVNRYFGYILVGQVRLSAEPFRPYSPAKDNSLDEPTPDERAEIAGVLAEVADDGLKEALRQLGHALIGRSRK